MKKIKTVRPERSLEGQVAMISGGLGDIGRATAQALQAAGARVALSDIGSAAVAARVMPGFHYTRVDVTDPMALRQWLRRVERTLGPPVIVVCNAGIVQPGAALRVTYAAWARTLAVNLSGGFFLAQLAGQRMVARKIRGRIVFVGSWAAQTPHAAITAYCVAKAGLRMAMQCLAVELAPHGILANEVAPGVVNAGLSGQLMARDRGLRRRTRRKIPTGALLEPEEVARGVLTLCEPQNRHMTGAVLLLDGGLTLRGPL